MPLRCHFDEVAVAEGQDVCVRRSKSVYHKNSRTRAFRFSRYFFHAQVFIYIKTSFYRITNPYDDLVVALIRNIEK